MKRILKWTGMFLLLMMGLVLLALASPFTPLTLIVSAIAYWFFNKKKPNARWKKVSKYGMIVSAVGIGILAVVLNMDTETDVASEVDVEAVASEVAEAELAAEKEAEEERERQEAQKAAEREKERAQEKAAREQERKEREEQERIAEANPNKTEIVEAPKEAVRVPEGKEEVVVNNNIPYFSNEDITSTEVYHRNGPLDALGRVTAANAVVGVEIMPAEERGSIGHHEPTGWNQARYANVDAGGWLYNRSHLIGHQLTGNDDFENLMTGTRWFNIRMLEYENFVANYVETTENHVRYRVTPVFEGNNLVASGAYMEGFSIEDNGEGLMFNIYIPNIQPGVEIAYADGASVGPEGPARDGDVKQYKAPKESASSKSSSESKSSSKPAPKPAPKPKVESKPEPKPEPKPDPKPEPAQPEGGNLAEVDANGNGKVTIQEAKDAGYKMPIKSDHWLYQYMDDRDGDGMVGE